MTLRLNLEQCGDKQLLHAVAAGRYLVEYNDSTHTAQDEWLKLGEIDIRANALEVADDGIEQFYMLECNPGPLPALGGNNPTDRRIRTLQDALALILGRVGLLTPKVSNELLADLLELDAEDGVVIVPDTNALHNGAVHWLLRVLKHPSVWLMPVVASLTTVQTRDAMVKELVGKRAPSKLVQALRSRGLVNGALGLLQRNRGRSQVIEIDPSLLRYQKQASTSGMDPDQSDVLEDRLIIEAIHGVLRSMRSRSARRVVTSDVNIARVLEAEGIRTLFIPTIILPAEPIACIRFDAVARAFVGAPLRALLWEMTHVFGSIRLRRADGYEPVRLECYWPGKTPAQWSSETLTATFATFQPTESCEPVGDAASHPKAADTLIPDPTDSVAPAATDVKQDDAREQSNNDSTKEKKTAYRIDVATRDVILTPSTPTDGRNTIEGDDVSTQRVEARPEDRDATPLNDPIRLSEVERLAPSRIERAARAHAKTREIGVILPRASLPQIFTLLAASRRLGSASADKITAMSSKEPVTVDNARRALEILKRVGLLKQDGESYNVTPTVDTVEKAMASADLDSVSSIMTRFEPYARFLELLQRQGSIPRSEVAGQLREVLGKVGSYESERLPRFHILLGQAWSSGDTIMDGSQRPTDRDASDAFERAFEASASDGIASVIDLLRFFCEDTKMSPWASKQKIEGFVRQNLLSNYSFQTAAGRRPITADSVITGTLDTFVLEPVVVDRFQLGQRPVFTIERITR